MTIEYVGAEQGWACIAGGGQVAWVDLPAKDDRIGRIWSILREGAAAAKVLDLLTEAGLGSAPHFALVSTTDGSVTTILARGPVKVVATTRHGTEVFDATRNATWAERIVEDMTGLEMTLAGESSEGTRLPLVDGVARASAVVMPDPTGSPVSNAPKPAKKKKESIAIPDEAPVPADVGETMVPSSHIPEVEVVAVVERSREHALHDELFGATIVRSVEDAAVRGPELVAPPVGLIDEDDSGDHDGETIVGGDIANLRLSSVEIVESSPVEPVPSLILRSSSGQSISLARPVIIGRSPTVTTPTSSGELPELISVASSNPDVSRNHVQFTLEGGTVVVTDLHSRNGTMFTLPGKPAAKLRPGEQTPIVIGSLVDLGGGATYTVDVQP